MLVFDLDGTLLRNDKTVSDYTVAVLRRCREKGILVALATARSHWVAQRIVDIVQPDALIVNGGALAFAKGERVVDRRFSAETTDALLAAIGKCPSLEHITMGTEEGYFVTWEYAKHADHAKAIKTDFSKPLGMRAYKITPSFMDEKDAHRVAALFPECDMTGFTGEKWYRFSPKGADKLAALRAISGKLSIPLDNMAAFGDDWNDLDMIRGCGTGIAMGNAIDVLKRAADQVCLSNEEDGAARWIEAHLL